ncbi:MAG: hypothetical protein Kow0079_14330 [Vicingaceae bacterium]
MKKLTFIIICVFTLQMHYLNAQNLTWSCPPYYINFNGGTNTQLLPTPGAPGGAGTPGYDYDGRAAISTHNAMVDANGDLAFFIVDNVIFDKDGYYIDEFFFNLCCFLKILKGIKIGL